MTKINRYNEIASNPKNKPNQIVDLLNLQTGDKILEIGVGGGYYAKRFSERIGDQGRYYGVDTEDVFVENLNSIGVTRPNVKGIKIQPNEIPHLDDKVNIVFTRNVYHHLTNRTIYFKQIANLIEDNGRIVIIDYNECLSLFRLSGHYTKKALIINELKCAGFSVKEDFKLLNKQSFLIFEKD